VVHGLGAAAGIHALCHLPDHFWNSGTDLGIPNEMMIGVHLLLLSTILARPSSSANIAIDKTETDVRTLKTAKGL
jgi:hypothetical protein